MRKAQKNKDSEILINNLTYPKDKGKILEFLKSEQSNFCAYTDERINASFSTDVEHFNPNIKETSEDNYFNWYAVSTKWNKIKGTKNAKSRWERYQPLIQPNDENFESIIKFDLESCFYFSDHNDGQNLINYLHLNNDDLVEDRKKHLEIIKNHINDKNLNSQSDSEVLQEIINKNTFEFRFPRMIKEVFKIDIINQNIN